MIDVEKERANLPPELQKQLNKQGHSTAYDREIIDVLQECAGSANVDQLIVGLYLRHGRTLKRSALAAKLSYMFTVKKITRTQVGIYSLIKTDADTGQATDPTSRAVPAPTSRAVPAPAIPASAAFMPPGKLSKARRITCANCSTYRAYPENTTVLQFDGSAFCSAKCIKEYREGLALD